MSTTKSSGLTPIQPAVQAVPKGHYSPGMRGGDLLFISGQLPGDGSERDVPDFQTQVRNAMQAVLDIVAAAGGQPEQLVKVTVYLVGVEHWGTFNALYADMMGNWRPARAIVPVPELHHGYLVEIEAVAAIG